MVKIPKISIVVPAYNEADSLRHFHESLLSVLKNNKIDFHEIIYCDDGSIDRTPIIAKELHNKNSKVKLLRLSRNFGKEYALTAGIANASGDAIITIDADGQHPVELIPQFIKLWQSGNLVVVGVRTENAKISLTKRLGSKLFYVLINGFGSNNISLGSTDFCLIDSSVQKAFLSLPETNRLTRSLIDWLGFPKATIKFKAKSRAHGIPTYDTKKLFYLAINGLVAMSPVPLFIFGILGILITGFSFIIGTAILIEQILLGDPLNWNFTGTAQLSIFILFLVGIILISQGLLSMYILHIQKQTRQRPLYIIDYVNSFGLSENGRL
jgi:dolichol-phosphate mannosyltransferase